MYLDLKNINWIVLDVDGTLTDGSFLVSENGEKYKKFYTRDFSAIRRWIALGGNVALISGDDSSATRKWAEDARVKEIYLGVKSKNKTIQSLMEKHSINKDEIIAMGDDDFDLQMKGFVKYLICPSNAHKTIKEISHYITKSDSTNGAVRELIDEIIEQKYKFEITNTAILALTKYKIKNKIETQFIRVGLKSGGCNGYQFEVKFEDHLDRGSFIFFEAGGFFIVSDVKSINIIKGGKVDYVEKNLVGDFTIDFPGKTSECGCGTSFDLR